MIELPRIAQKRSTEICIKIIGLGGAGSNALDRIQLDGADSASLVAINTDAQALTDSAAPQKVQLGAEVTRGLGAGGDPELGYRAAEESADAVRDVLNGAEMVFICVGLGGGTGSGAAPLIASFARQENALVVVFATMPFSFEGRRRMEQAQETLATLQQYADVVICFENDRMADAVAPRAPIQEAFAVADQTLSQSVRALASLVQRRGLIDVGFDELATALRSQNARCLFGFGEAEGDNRVFNALEMALKSPLLDRGRMLADVQNVLIQVASGPTLTLNEVQILMEEFNRHIHDQTRILFGAVIDPKLGHRLSVTILSSVSAEGTIVAQLPVPVTFAAQLSAPSRRRAPEPEQEAEPGELLSGELVALEESRMVARNASQRPVQGDLRAASSSAAEAARVAPRAGMRPTAAETVAAKREARQEQMQFEPVTRGRFEKSEPTIIDGQDLDVPTFLRRNVRPK